MRGPVSTARRDGLGTLASRMLQSGRRLVDEADLIVPVPLHCGSGQSGWLAQDISRLSGTPVMVDSIKRTRRTSTQGGLSARARPRDVAGAFTITRRAATRISGRRVLLVDDVLTTGATVSACTRALKQAGAANVDVLVLARVVRETYVTI